MCYGCGMCNRHFLFCHILLSENTAELLSSHIVPRLLGISVRHRDGHNPNADSMVVRCQRLQLPDKLCNMANSPSSTVPNCFPYVWADGPASGYSAWFQCGVSTNPIAIYDVPTNVPPPPVSTSTSTITTPAVLSSSSTTFPPVISSSTTTSKSPGGGTNAGAIAGGVVGGLGEKTRSFRKRSESLTA